MRNKELDFLRGLAIVLVMMRHNRFESIISFGGGIGVDLFFVLSGFLVSGLLFDEYKKYGNIKPGLFLIRRGFKIYPSYFLALGVAVVWLVVESHSKHTLVPWDKVVWSVLFLQNYFGGILSPTWSLGVEEHFYIALAALVFWLTKNKSLTKHNKFLYLFFAVAVSAIGLRVITLATLPISLENNRYPSHLRVDSLMFGALIAFYYHFHRNRLDAFYFKYRAPLLIGSAAIIWIPFWSGVPDYYTFSIEYTILYIAFGSFMVALLIDPAATKLLQRIISPYIFRLLAFTGLYSYNIYLWHTGTMRFLDKLLDKVAPTLKSNEWAYTALYFAFSLALGILLTYIIETPFLKLRDKYFPKRKKQAHEPVQAKS
ncbi:MAG: acyltransferase [Bacteroidota bacterium]